MANPLNEFDRLIKESYENHREPYNPEHWEELEEELAVVSPSFSGFIQAIAGGVVLTAAVMAVMMLWVADGTGEQHVANDHREVEQTTDNGEAEEASAHQTTTIAPAGSGQPAAVAETAEPMDETIERTDEPEAPRSTATTSPAKPKPAPATEPVIASVEPASEEETPGIRSGCTGMTIRFNAPKDYADDARFLWNFGDGYFSNESDPSHTFNKEGVFDVSLSVTSHSTGQISSNVIQAMIEVAEAPSADFSYAIGSMDELKITNTSYGASRVDWTLDGNEIADAAEVSISLADNTKHELTLNAFNHTGCSDTLTRAIFVSEADNRFPKAHSPSHTSGFAPGAIIDGGEVIDFRVFRPETGVEVFRASGTKGWMGTDADGKTMKPGEYHWVMLVENTDAIQVYRGKVKLRE